MSSQTNGTGNACISSERKRIPVAVATTDSDKSIAEIENGKAKRSPARPKSRDCTGLPYCSATIRGSSHMCETSPAPERIGRDTKREETLKYIIERGEETL